MVTIRGVSLYNSDILNSNFKNIIMKRADKSSDSTRNFDLFISQLSVNEILNIQAMSFVRGGDGEGNSGEPVISIPKPPKV